MFLALYIAQALRLTIPEPNQIERRAWSYALLISGSGRVPPCCNVLQLFNRHLCSYRDMLRIWISLLSGYPYIYIYIRLPRARCSVEPRWGACAFPDPLHLERLPGPKPPARSDGRGTATSGRLDEPSLAAAQLGLAVA